MCTSATSAYFAGVARRQLHPGGGVAARQPAGAVEADPVAGAAAAGGALHPHAPAPASPAPARRSSRAPSDGGDWEDAGRARAGERLGARARHAHEPRPRPAPACPGPARRRLRRVPTLELRQMPWSRPHRGLADRTPTPPSSGSPSPPPYRWVTIAPEPRLVALSRQHRLAARGWSPWPTPRRAVPRPPDDAGPARDLLARPRRAGGHPVTTAGHQRHRGDLRGGRRRRRDVPAGGGQRPDLGPRRRHDARVTTSAPPSSSWPGTSATARRCSRRSSPLRGRPRRGARGLRSTGRARGARARRRRLGARGRRPLRRAGACRSRAASPARVDERGQARAVGPHLLHDHARAAQGGRPQLVKRDT